LSVKLVSLYNTNTPFPEPAGIDPTTPDSQVGIRFLLPLVGCIGALFVGWFITCDANPLTTTTLVAGLVMCCVALSNPVGGVYLLIFTTGYLDLAKRLGILSEALSGIDVVVTLALAPVLFVAICGGVLYYNIISRVWLRPWQVGLAVAILVVMAGVFCQAFLSGGGAAFALKDFANSGVYLLLILVGCFLFADVASVQRLLRFTLLIYAPVAVYGIWQQLFGLTTFEADYLKSGFTIDIGLLDDVRLRPFSTLNSPHALSVVMAMLSIVALVIPLHGPRRAWWQLPVGLILVGGCIASFVRAGWVLFLLALIIWVCSRRRLTTFLMYGTIAAGFTFLFINADPLLQSLDRIDGILPDSGDVQNQAFRTGTFSDRLISFHNVMSNPTFHTWFGNRDVEELEEGSRENAAHDQIGQILISYGFGGLILFGTALVLGLWFAHLAVFRQRDRLKRQILLGVLSVVLATILSGMLFGSHLSVFPINVLFYLLVSTMFVVSRTTEPLATGPINGTRPIAAS
jgi:hypothetical protein